jgi:FkbM family methyltransferase
MAEVLDREEYHKPSVGFNVEPGEHWLDLGANVGYFAVYCKLRGATAECYEPEPGNFAVLLKNAEDFVCERSAVCATEQRSVTLCVPSDVSRLSRCCVQEQGKAVRGLDQLVQARSTPARILHHGEFDGVKMDIEGAEGPIIDAGYIPKCRKLVLEYHTSRDPSADNLKRRIGILKRTFPNVMYRPEYDRLMTEGGTVKTFFDRLIFCWF